VNRKKVDITIGWAELFQRAAGSLPETGVARVGFPRLEYRLIQMVFKNVVRCFSLMLHDPKGSHYKNLKVKNNKCSCEALASPLRPKLERNETA
jgi:hypothetical protein